MPAEREEPLRLDPVDGDFKRYFRVLALSLRHLRIHRGPDDDSPLHRPWPEGAVELHAEPLAELLHIGERLPHPTARRPQHDAFLDPIGTGDWHVQPPGCMLRGADETCNHLVALRRLSLRPAQPMTATGT